MKKYLSALLILILGLSLFAAPGVGAVKHVYADPAAPTDWISATLLAKGNLDSVFSQYAKAEAKASAEYEFTITNESDHEKTSLTALDILPNSDVYSVAPNPQTGVRERRYGTVSACLTGPVRGLPAGFTAYYTTEICGDNSESFADNSSIWSEAVSNWSAVKAVKVVMDSSRTLGVGETIKFYMDVETSMYDEGGNLIDYARSPQAVINDFAVKSDGGFIYGNSNENRTTLITIRTYQLRGQIFYDLDENGYCDFWPDVEPGTEQTVVTLVDESGQAATMPDGGVYPAAVTTVGNYPSNSGYYYFTAYRSGNYGIKVKVPDNATGITLFQDDYSGSRLTEERIEAGEKYAYSALIRMGEPASFSLYAGFIKATGFVVPYQFNQMLPFTKYYGGLPVFDGGGYIYTMWYPIADGQFKFNVKRVISGIDCASLNPGLTVSDTGGDIKIDGASIGIGDYITLQTESSDDGRAYIPFNKTVLVCDPGTYVFEVSEVVEANTGIIYDSRVMYLVIHAELDGGGIYVDAVTYTWDDGSVAKIGQEYQMVLPFMNTKEQKIEIDVKGSKSLTGNNLASGQFEFTMELTSGDASEVEGLEAGNKKVVKNDASGSIDFGTLSFTKEGSYIFDIKETDAGAAGYTYDSSIYTLTVNVADDGEGGLTETHTLTKTDAAGGTPQAADAISFENTYTPASPGSAPCEVNPPIKKVVQGDPKEDAEFTFIMKALSNTAGYEVVDMPMPAESVNGEKRVTVKGAGEYEFGAFEITRPGTYVYSAAEEKGNAAGYVYDTTQYTITFDVTDENDQLKAKMIIVDGEGGTAKTCEFTNIYAVDSPPETGDSGNTAAWLLLMLSSLLTTIIISIKRARTP